MPFTVDEDRMQQKPGATQVASLDPAKPPVKEIPFMEYPRVVYKHPKEPFRKIEHRNQAFEVVGVETIPAEHLTLLVANHKELEKALKEGWRKDPYICPPLPDPNANLYEDAK